MTGSLSSPEHRPSLRLQLFKETDIMLRHALSQGLQVTSDMTQRLDAYRDLDNGRELSDLTRLHTQLAQLVSPATPVSLMFLDQERQKRSALGFLGNVSLVRQLTAVSIFSMIAMFALSLSPSVDGEASNFSLFSNSGLNLLLNELFLLSAASLGVSFANLYQANLYLKNSTFDPRFESSYWVRYVLGLMSGSILAFLVPVDHWLEGSAQAGTLHGMGKPTLALLGGFSAQAIYRILFKMVNAVESLVRGSSQEALENEKAQVRLDSERRELQTKAELSAKLRSIRDSIPAEHPAAESLSHLADHLTGIASQPLIVSDPAEPATDSASHSDKESETS